MSESFSIRQCVLDDAERMAEISAEAWKWAYSAFLPEDFILERTNLARRTKRIRETWNSESLVLAAIDADGVVWGFASEHKPCALDGYDAEIGGLYVHPDVARTGVGGELVRTMVKDFLSRGMNSMAIHTLAQNEIGCRFYSKLGGIRDKEDTWNGYPSVWYVWDTLIDHF